MNKLKLFLLFTLLPLLSMAGNTLKFHSPSNNLTTEVNILSDNVLLKVSSENKLIADIQTLKFDLKKEIIEGDWKLKTYSETTNNSSWTPIYGERKSIKDNYNEVKLNISSSINEKDITLILRLYDEGIAFRYIFDELDFWNSIVTKENTLFNFLNDSEAWVSTRAQSAIFKQKLSQLKDTIDRPVLIKDNQGKFITVGEAALVDYARMKFHKGDDSNSLESSLHGDVNLDLANYETPWRYIMIGESAGELLENNDFILNLNEPNEIQNTEWIKPGKVLREVTLTTTGAIACVDFAVRNKIEYVEFDAGWYGHEYYDSSDASAVNVDPQRSKGPLDLEYIVDYADKRGVGIILYVNMRALRQQLDQILPLYKKWGIKGLKYGFVDVGDQYSTSWLHHAVRKAAKYELMVDIHDEYRPTGYSRTYPNLLTQEGIRGDEETPSLNQSIYTLFTRMIAGAGDYTNCFFAERVYEGKMGGKAAQMAKAIAIYSPWQFIYWYDRPSHSNKDGEGAGGTKSSIVEDEITDFYKEMPTVWDDTKVLESNIENFATVARKSGDSWYIGNINAGEGRNVSISLDFLDKSSKYNATIYYQTKSDIKKNSVSKKQVQVTKEGLLQQFVEANSGFAVVISKSF